MALSTLNQVCSLVERKWKRNLKIMMMLFNNIVRGMMLYGSEVWRWERQPRLERLHVKYIKCAEEGYRRRWWQNETTVMSIYTRR